MVSVNGPVMPVLGLQEPQANFLFKYQGEHSYCNINILMSEPDIRIYIFHIFKSCWTPEKLCLRWTAVEYPGADGSTNIFWTAVHLSVLLHHRLRAAKLSVEKPRFSLLVLTRCYEDSMRKKTCHSFFKCIFYASLHGEPLYLYLYRSHFC